MRTRLTGVALLLAAVVGGWAWGAADPTTGKIDGSDHDLRTRLGITQVCLPCHAPHNAKNAEAGPLWNHALSTATFVRNGKSITLSGSSKLCMSCHDGVTAVGSYGNMTGSDPITGGAALGNDFTNDHPVGVEYGAGGGIYEAAADVASYLEDGKVECSSCHRAHTAGTDGKFLRVTISGSQLCRVCHTF